MKKVSESIAAKTAAFILIVLLSVVTVLSAAVIVVNAQYQWYSKSSEKAEEDINYEIASFAANEIMTRLYTYGDDGTDDAAVEIADDEEILYGEDSAEEFGYRIVLNKNDEGDILPVFKKGDKTTNIRTVNEDFINGKTVSYSRNFKHDGADVEIYLGNHDEMNSFPEELNDTISFYEIAYKAYKYGKTAIVTAVLSMIVMLALFIFLMISIGRKKDTNKAILRIPIELYIIAAVIIIAMIMMIIMNVGAFTSNIDMFVLMIVVTVVTIVSVILGLLIIMVIKARHHVLWQNSIILMIFKGLKYACSFVGRKTAFLLKSIPVVWKSAVLVFAGIMVNLFITVGIWLSYGYISAYWILWLIGAVLIEGVTIYTASGFKRLREAGEYLAHGALDYKVDEKGMFLDLKKHAEDLNHISDGMASAVAEKMKSEHFKTELITNVSHDIKTPLTSIINYVDLLKGEDIDNEKADEYLEVLDRQSQRLKKLTEDLVEASKAATGNVNLDMHPCKVSVLMMQVCGEYDEKFKEKQLELVSHISNENAEVMADGKSMWRIFDNILNNICKYSQPGTRVYQSLEKEDNRLIITYKNTSEYQLNISEEELMERFVRGDSSRHTEGSGLGLSIAKNLTALQAGNFKISIDGDLFKVIMDFPCLPTGNQESHSAK